MGTKEIRQSLAEGDLASALQALFAVVDEPGQLNRATSLSFRAAELKRLENSGTSDPAELKKEQNQIITALLALVNELETRPAPPPNPQSAIHNPQSTGPLRAYLSVGTPHNEQQAQFLEFLRNYFRLKGVSLETVGTTSWSSRKPLIPIKEKLESVSGCVVLATERFTANDGFFRKGSTAQEHCPTVSMTTAWTHIEAAMAYQLGLPLLILREKKVRSEGMIDPGTHEWNVYDIDLADHEAISTGRMAHIIEGWVEEVGAFAGQR